jgi:hypothetical protein
MQSLRFFCSLAIASVVGLASFQASSEEPVAWKLPPPTSAAPDDLSKHFMVAPRLAWLVPMGDADSKFAQRFITGTGMTFGLDALFGISRYVDVHARFDYGMLGEASKCPPNDACKASTTWFGLGLGYHLVNGASFDPWIQAGVGYRFAKFEQSPSSGPTAKWDYSGVDWMRLAIGGEWYAAKWLGFGPYASFDAGTYSARPSGTGAGSAVHMFLSLGLRAVIDPSR